MIGDISEKIPFICFKRWGCFLNTKVLAIFQWVLGLYSLIAKFLSQNKVEKGYYLSFSFSCKERKDSNVFYLFVGNMGSEAKLYKMKY